MPKRTLKTRLDKMTETHAKKETFKPAKLEQLWGFNPESKFGTLDAEEYRAKLNSMDNMSLLAHAKENGFVAYTTNYEMLKAQLVQNFQRYVAQFRVPVEEPQKPIKITPELEKIMRLGR